MSEPVPAPPSARRFKVAFETVTWGQRIDDLDYMCQVLQACGYKGIEIAQNPQNIFIREDGKLKEIGPIDTLVERCARYDIEVIGLVGGTLEERVAYLGKRRDIYLYLDSWPEDAWKYLVQEKPITLVIHPHWLMPIRRRSQVEELFEKVHKEVCEHFMRISKKKQSSEMEAIQDALEKTTEACENLRLIVDTAHAVIAEDNPVAFVKDCLCDQAEVTGIKSPLFGKLQNVHLKGWIPDYGRWSHRYPKGFCVPSHGIVPVKEVMQALVESSFAGWIVLEQDHFENSREETALTCVEWIMESRDEWSVEIELNKSAWKSLAENHPPNPFGAQASTVGLKELVIAFDARPANSPEAFYRSAVTTLNRLLKPEYVKLFSYNPSTEKFYLLDAIGRDGGLIDGDKSISQHGTLAGRVAATSRVLFRDLTDEKVREKFLNKGFLSHVMSRWLVCVPIFDTANAHHLRGMFAIFTDQDLRKEKHMLEWLAHLIAMWADYVGGESCAAAAGATNYICGNAKSGVVPFIDDLRDHLLEAFHCEAVSIFLRDASRTRLEPVGKCIQKIEWNKELPPTEHHYKLGEGLTGRCWKEREMLFADHAPRAPGHKGKSKDLPLTDREEVLFAPLARLGGEVLGVIRLRNKDFKPDSPASTMFTDEDAGKLDAIIQSALPYLELLLTQKDQAQSLVRLNHELQNPLMGITGAVEFLQEALKKRGISDLKQEFGADFLDDVLSYKDLMSRLALNAKLFGDSFDSLKPNFEHCDLATTVVEPVARQLRPLLRRYKLPDGRISIEKFQGTIPWLWVDKLMMQQVFFNLLVNAIKYRDNAQNFEIKVQVHCHSMNGLPVEYWIDVVDFGVGLDDDAEAAERMFLSGVRGVTSSTHKDVSGTGIGLSVVREVMRKHDGRVFFVPNEPPIRGGFGGPPKDFNPYRKPTRVRLCFPASLRLGKPRTN
ncbi:ATP-binding protein [Prosthecobacter sp.]|uniref:ATP-binding protein n=1 Tax=Prosthecobacter sp. TaxID=1965333 RepID=UPI002ABB86CC|nr:ATP-binding protein [Prosthecobacter sp.]MDZ4403778.1 ATP-binding protein [Prosthecobacter sp.]